MNLDDIVALRRGGGREGRIVSKSAQDGRDWLIAWRECNILTHERERALRLVSQHAETPARRPPGRAGLAIVARRQAAGN